MGKFGETEMESVRLICQSQGALLETDMEVMDSMLMV